MKNIPIRSILPPKIGELDSFRIFSISEVLCGESMNQALHRHDFYFILLVSRGTGIHEIDFVTYPITDNTISIMRPGQVHQLELKAGSEGYWLAFNKDFEFLPAAKNNTLLRKATRRNFYNLHKKDVNALSSILQIILAEYKHCSRRCKSKKSNKPKSSKPGNSRNLVPHWNFPALDTFPVTSGST